MSVSTDDKPVGMAEADHRFSNNLAGLSAVIRLQQKSISCSTKSYSAPEVCILFDDISARIEVMARLHKSLALTANGNGINLGDFLKEISAMIATLCSPGNLHLTEHHSCQGCVDPRDALHAALITAELLSNASKYAHPTGLPVKVHVHCETAQNGSFVVEVTDDGVGFPEHFDPATDGGLGFQLMRALAHGLDAQLDFQHDSLGVCARLVKFAGENPGSDGIRIAANNQRLAQWQSG